MLERLFTFLASTNPALSVDHLVTCTRDGSLRLPPHEAASLISLLPAEEVLNTSELAALHRHLEQRPKADAIGPSDEEAFVFTVKLTRLCNLRCTYCNSWRTGPGQVMPFNVMLATVDRALMTPGAGQVEFVWHGGEVTMLSPRMAMKMIWIQERLRRSGQHITNSLQTNAVDISQDWLDMIAFLRIRVGVSLDGLALDDLRLDAEGRSSRGRALAGVAKLKGAGISFGALSVIKGNTLSIDPDAFFHAYIEAGIPGINLLNVIPSNDLETLGDDDEFLPIDDFMAYAAKLFEAWTNGHWDRIYVDFFVDLMKSVIDKRKSPTCLWSGDCTSHFLTVEANGTLGPCDKFVGAPDTRFGNIVRDGVEDMIGSSIFVEQWESDRPRASEEFASCRWKDVCHGGCPHDRMLHFKKFGERRAGCCGLSPVLTAIEAFDREQPFMAREILRRWSLPVEPFQSAT